MMKKIHLGATLYSLNIGNAARNVEQVLTPVTVNKVGRKYFTTRNIDDSSGYSDTQYYLSTWEEKSDYSAKSQLWESKEEYEDSIVAKKICHKLWKEFEYGRNKNNVSIEILKKIERLLEKQDE